ncbi:MAG: type secretion-associated protein ImpA family, partial [Gammaproteobacteria bacterium]|nr:type secretion-associated protein ImpA family [Gammaproteobacteria bacterium]
MAPGKGRGEGRPARDAWPGAPGKGWYAGAKNHLSREIESLLDPISAEAPCGVDLEDTQLLAGFDAFRLFGNATPLPVDTEWRAIRDQSLEALTKSRDLRLLAHLAAAIVRIDGLTAFCSVLAVADGWLTQHWDLVFPRVDEDALLRKNALSCFADRMAVVDAVRRVPVVAHRQFGAFCLRDLELSAGQLTPTEADTNAPTAAQIDATLAGTSVEELAALAGKLTAATGALRSIVAAMQNRGGYESAPDFEPVLKPLARLEKLCAEQLQTRMPGTAADAGESGGAADGVGGAPAGSANGEIKSRQDAIRAIDAAATFFRKNEPS